MILDTKLRDKLKMLVEQEKKIKEFKSRLRVKGKIINKGVTKKGNISLTIKEDDNEYKFTILKSHKERFKLAQKLNIGRSVSVVGIEKLRFVICTKLKTLDKGISEGKQTKLEKY